MRESASHCSPITGYLFVAALLLAAGTCAAQGYPGKPIRIIVPFPAGGIADLFGRVIGQKFSEAWGQPGVVDNRPGAGGNIGAELVAKAPPDGYTLVTGNNATFGANVSLFKSLPYDPVKDFSPIALVATQPNILVVHPSLPVISVVQRSRRAFVCAWRFASDSAGEAPTAACARNAVFKAPTLTPRRIWKSRPFLLTRWSSIPT